MLKVKEGFHHDLNANATVELRGPTLPCNDEIQIFIELDVIHNFKHNIATKKLPSARSFYWLARMQLLEMLNLGYCLMFWHHQPYKTCSYKNKMSPH